MAKITEPIEVVRRIQNRIYELAESEKEAREAPQNTVRSLTLMAIERERTILARLLEDTIW